jgi:hypothetical protein
MISGFNIVVSTSLHISKDWPCVLKVTCLSLPGFGTFRVTDCECCRQEEASFVRQSPIRDVCEKSFYHECWRFVHYAI